MNVAPEAVRQLRERTGAGVMECKKALVDSGGDLDAAAELMRKQGLARADKKAARVAAEGVIVVERSADGRAAAMVEINCETDFVAREHDFRHFAAEVARLALARRESDLAALLAAELSTGVSVDTGRRALVAKIGENISVRRCVALESHGALGAYVHGTRIGALVALEGGSAELAHNLAMHVAASNPCYLNAAAVPTQVLAKEREILGEQALREGKSPEIVERMIEGRLRKAVNEMTLLGQPYVRDPAQSIEQLLRSAGASVTRFERFEVGAGIEKKQQDFVAEVMAQVSAAGQR